MSDNDYENNIDEIRPSWCEYDPNVDNPVKLSASHSIPAPLAKCLRPYQIDGIRFLYGLYLDPKVGGGLLADEMGLGKTIQAIGLLTALSQKTNIGVIDENTDSKNIRGHYLVVSPASILYNWESEFITWSYFSIGVYYGPNRRQDIIYKNPEKYEVILTTYDILREDIDVLSSLLPWSVIILDEIHRLKNPKSSLHVILKSHLSSIPLKIGLAGIILQNNYQEMWALLDWVNPDCLGKWKYFNEKYSKPIELGLRQNATSSQLAKARLLQKDLDSLKNNWILRRVKKDKFVDLPTKVDKIVYCAPTTFQIALFRKLLSCPEMKELWAKRDKKRYFNRATHKGAEKKKAQVFTFIHLFLKVANHVGLLASEFSKKSSKNQSEIGSTVIAQVLSDFYKDIARDSFMNLTDTKYSGKMVVLADLLSALKKENGNKCLLFSYSTKVLDILEQFLQTRGYEYLRIDGETPARLRFSIVNEFNQKPGIFILLLSTKAGGLGLNITGANVVIVYDPNWNPSHDLQAQDRAYRIGQTKDVRVFRLITSGCIEENIYLRQLYKQQLFSNAVDGQKVRRYFKGSPNFDKREVFGVKNLFTVKTGGISLTETIFKRNEEMEQSFKNRKYHIDDFELDPKKLFEGNDPFMIDVCEEDSDEKIISNYRKKKPKSVMESVLSSKNILHVHENISVIGGSRVEEEISEHAIRGETVDTASSKTSDPNSSKSIIIPPLRHLKAYKDKIYCTSVGTVFYGQTPNVMIKRDFTTMASGSGLSEREFALKVVEMSPVELANVLKKFYESVKKLNQAHTIFKTVIEDIKEEELVLQSSKANKSIISLNDKIMKKNKRPLSFPEHGKGKKRLALESYSIVEPRENLFPPDSLFDAINEEEKLNKKDTMPNSSSYASESPSKIDTTFKSLPNSHFFDSEEIDFGFTNIKERETTDSLEETQVDLSLLAKSPSKSEEQNRHSSEVANDSFHSQKIPKPPPEGIYYTSKYRKDEKMESDKFYDTVFKSQKTETIIDGRVPELRSHRSESPLFDDVDSVFFNSIFTPSPSKFQKDVMETEDPLLTQWIKKGTIKKP